MLKNTVQAWGWVAKSFHWLLALLIPGQLVLGWIAEEAPVSPQKFELFVWHKSIGISILLLAILRLGWRFANAAPATPAGIASWEERFARGGHVTLYILMLAVPLSGWWVADTSRIPFKLFWHVPVPDLVAPDKQLSELAASMHGLLTTALIVVVFVHVLAALRHHFLLRNNTLRRMLPSISEPRS